VLASSDPGLIHAALSSSGLPAPVFALYVVRVPIATFERWRDGIEAIPLETRNRLEWFLTLTPWEREVFIDVATLEG
jgi:hypothetical protein